MKLEERTGFYDPSLPFYRDGRPSMEQRILDGARRCMLQYGSDKMTLGDVARMAGISRNSIYKYFNTRDEVVAAVVDWSGDTFAAEATAAMLEAGPSLETEVAAAAGLLVRWRREATTLRRNGVVTDSDEALVASQGSPWFLARLMAILRPRLAEARRRGDLRARIDIDRGTEWVARQIHSLASVAGPAFDADQATDVDDFVRNYVVGGLLPKPVAGSGRRGSKAVPVATPALAGDWSSVNLDGRHPTEIKILVAARDCLFRMGTARMTLEEVARAGNVSRGSVYAYFPTRDRLIFSVFDYGRQVLIQDLERSLRSQKSIEDGIVAATLMLAQWSRAVDASGAVGADFKAIALTREGQTLLDPLVEVMRAHLDRAAPGELRAGIPHDRAAESVARFLASIPTVAAQAFDAADPEDLAGFVRSHVLRGLM